MLCHAWRGLWEWVDAHSPVTTWPRFAAVFLGAFAGGIALLYLFVVLVDPYHVVPFSLPMERPIVSISQRHMYPQIVRSGQFDSLLVGTSTSRLLDPEILDGPFHAHLANLAMNSMTAWEQKTMIDYFLRRAGPPKLLIIAVDIVWCQPDADRVRTTIGPFPDWLYDDNPWNDFLYLLNSGTVEIAGRLVGYHLGLYPPRVRYDGYEEFTAPEQDYDLSRAQARIWMFRTRPAPPDAAPPQLSAAERAGLSFPALAWMDDALARLPAATRKVIALMPVHVAAQPVPGSRDAADEAECKARIAAIGRTHGASVVDWRIPSVLTREDSNYWDSLHYRVPIARRLAHDLTAAVLDGRDSPDGTYRVLAR